MTITLPDNASTTNAVNPALPDTDLVDASRLDNRVADHATAGTASAATDTESTGPAGLPGVPGSRSDDDLLALLDEQIPNDAPRPTRQEVIDMTGVGSSRAARLLALLDDRRQWPIAGQGKRRTGTRPGASGRARTARTPRPDAPASASAGTSTEVTDPPAPEPVSPPASTDSTDSAARAEADAAAPITPGAPSTATGGPALSMAHGGGRLVAWAGFVFGSVTSVAANVLAARIPPSHAPLGWSPSLTAEVGAAVWPLALLLSVEVLSRVRWPRDWYWAVAKFGGAVAVAGGSAVISYGHINDVLATWNYSPAGSGVGPLVIDGLMVVSGFALLAIGRIGSHGPDSPRKQGKARR